MSLYCGIPKRHKITFTDFYIQFSFLVEWPAQLNPSSWVLSHLQESAKNTSLPSLFDPRTLALSILILFLKKKKNLSLLNLHSIHLLLVFLKTKQLTLAFLIFLYSIRFLFIYYIIKKNLLRVVYCIKLTETCYSTCISLLFCWFWLLPLSSFVSRFG